MKHKDKILKEFDEKFPKTDQMCSRDEAYNFLSQAIDQTREEIIDVEDRIIEKLEEITDEKDIDFWTDDDYRNIYRNLKNYIKTLKQ